VDDAELLKICFGGDESPSANWCGANHSTLGESWRAYYVASAASAEDVAQDTWIAVSQGHREVRRAKHLQDLVAAYLREPRPHVRVKEHRSIPVDPNESGPTVSAHRFDQGGFWSDPPVPFTEAIDTRLDNTAVLNAVA